MSKNWIFGLIPGDSNSKVRREGRGEERDGERERWGSGSIVQEPAYLKATRVVVGSYPFGSNSALEHSLAICPPLSSP